MFEIKQYKQDNSFSLKVTYKEVTVYTIFHCEFETIDEGIVELRYPNILDKASFTSFFNSVTSVCNYKNFKMPGRKEMEELWEEIENLDKDQLILDFLSSFPKDYSALLLWVSVDNNESYRTINEQGSTILNWENSNSGNELTLYGKVINKGKPFLRPFTKRTPGLRNICSCCGLYYYFQDEILNDSFESCHLFSDHDQGEASLRITGKKPRNMSAVTKVFDLNDKTRRYLQLVRE